jgi:hypothetical protein
VKAWLFLYGFHGNFSICTEALKFISIDKDKTAEVCFSAALLNIQAIHGADGWFT